jgi:hypothetical protein
MYAEFWSGNLERRGHSDVGMDLKEIGLEGQDWIHLAQKRDYCQAVVSTVMNLRVS